MKPQHAKLSASGAKRWMSCPGSVALSLKAPPQPSSPYAEEGTKAHAVLEKLLTAKSYMDALVDEQCRNNPDMVMHAHAAALEIISRAEGADQMLCETKVSLEFVQEGMFGTVDAAIVNEFGRLTVIDFKYGAGIVVSPEDNEQLLYYALGLAHKYNYNFEDVELLIIQPRADDERGPIRSWVTPIETLIDWREKFKKGAEACSKPDAPLVAGSHCKFCPAAVICPEIGKKALAQARIDFEPVIEPPQVMPTVERLPEILAAIPKIEAYIKAIEAHAYNLLSSGQEIPGWKLVEKRGIRKWVNDSVLLEACALFGEENVLEEPKLKSPAQLEKLKFPGVKEFVVENCASVSSGLTLVPSTDKRQAYGGMILSAQNDFAQIDE